MEIPRTQRPKESEGVIVTKIIVAKNSPRYQVVDEGSYLIDLKDLSNDEFLSLTEDNNFDGLITTYGKPI